MRGDRPLPEIRPLNLYLFTPHARGSTFSTPFIIITFPVYPACAGIDPRHKLRPHQLHGLPRMRGDRPLVFMCCTKSFRFTPHARGSTCYRLNCRTVHVVYPACAGIDLPNFKPCVLNSSLPRMRGDRPILPNLSSISSQFTPHARGSTRIQPLLRRKSLVYPACAGIDLTFLGNHLIALSLPRMRGDRPLNTSCFCKGTWFTPHARGSTPYAATKEATANVYPACAGIDPNLV